MLIAFVVYLFLFIKSLWNIIDILFGEKVANKLIRKLYEELWYSPVRKIKCEEKTLDVSIDDAVMYENEIAMQNVLF